MLDNKGYKEPGEHYLVDHHKGYKRQREHYMLDSKGYRDLRRNYKLNTKGYKDLRDYLQEIKGYNYRRDQRVYMEEDLSTMRPRRWEARSLLRGFPWRRIRRRRYAKEKRSS